MDLGQIASEVDWNVSRGGLSAIGTVIRARIRDEVKAWAEGALWPPPRPGRRGVGEPHDWTFLCTVSNQSITVATPYFTLPTDFVRPRSVDLVQTTGKYRELELGTYPELERRYAGRLAAEPSEYAIDLSTANPICKCYPFADQTYTVVFRYMREPVALTADGSTNEFTNNYSDGIIQGATARVLRSLLGVDPAALADWQGQAAASLAKAIAGDRRAQLQTDVKVWVSPNAEATPENPRPIMEDGSYRRITPDY